MKKIILCLVMVISLVTITACNFSEKKQLENDIKKFIKNNMIAEWAYSDSKISFKNDSSVQLLYYNVADWSSCALSTNNAILYLVRDNDEILQKIPSITFACKNTDGKDIAKTTYTNLKDLNELTLDNYSKYYDANGKEISESLKEAYKKSCKEYDYEELVKNYNSYIGKKIEFNGKVVQITDNESEDFLYIAVNRVDHNQENTKEKMLVIIRRNRIEKKIKKGDTYTFYGELLGIANSNTQYGVNANSPSAHVFFTDAK